MPVPWWSGNQPDINPDRLLIIPPQAYSLEMNDELDAILDFTLRLNRDCNCRSVAGYNGGLLLSGLS
jgi:hypothetical protein